MTNSTVARPEVEAVMEAFYSAMIAKDATALASLCADDVRWCYPFIHSPNSELRGRAATRSRYAAGWAAAPVRPISIDTVGLHLGDDGVVTAEAQMQLEHDNGERFEAAFILCFELRGGLIAWMRDYTDALTIAIKLDRVREV